MASSLQMISSSIKLQYLCLVWLVLSEAAFVKLTPNYYARTCPNALAAIKSGVDAAISKANSTGPALLRLHFHDCFVNGCDGSVLLDSTANFTSEKEAAANKNSLRGFDVIDTIKTKLESLCPGVVSCADILAVAARDAVFALGGPNYTVLLGRRDSTTANVSAANADLPQATMNLSQLIQKFASQGLSTKDMVVLSGGHTIGVARCVNFRSRIYNETNINSTYATSLKKICPVSGGGNNTAPLELHNDTSFDNYYYKDLLSLEGLLHSDQQLYNGGSTDSLVVAYSKNISKFFKDFGTSMIKMGNIKTLTGSKGQIRTNCRKINSIDYM
ncbi:NAD(+) salvage pathway protein [Ancistrocladus abbreviatus]